MRNADINFVNINGKTPLHHAIENNLDEKTIKFLLNNGANPHIEDFEGNDVCDIVQNGLYSKKSNAEYTRERSEIFGIFWSDQCKNDPSLRQNSNQPEINIMNETIPPLRMQEIKIRRKKSKTARNNSQLNNSQQA